MWGAWGGGRQQFLDFIQLLYNVFFSLLIPCMTPVQDGEHLCHGEKVRDAALAALHCDQVSIWVSTEDKTLPGII